MVFSEVYYMRRAILLTITFFLLSSLGFAACPDGMVSYWTFDNDSVSEGVALDMHGNNNGSIYGATPGASARVGEAFSFDGNDDYVEVPPYGALDVGDGLTLVA